MESELNGLKYDDFKDEIERFTRLFCSDFAGDYISESRNAGVKAWNGQTATLKR